MFEVTRLDDVEVEYSDDDLDNAILWVINFRGFNDVAYGVWNPDEEELVAVVRNGEIFDRRVK